MTKFIKSNLIITLSIILILLSFCLTACDDSVRVLSEDEIASLEAEKD